MRFIHTSKRVFCVKKGIAGKLLQVFTPKIFRLVAIQSP